MNKGTSPHFVLCVRNTGFRTSLVARKIYRALPDPDARRRGLLRVVDESGEDYLFPDTLFVAIALPRAAARAFDQAG